MGRALSEKVDDVHERSETDEHTLEELHKFDGG
jgi:hypothetical protein